MQTIAKIGKFNIQVNNKLLNKYRSYKDMIKNNKIQS